MIRRLLRWGVSALVMGLLTVLALEGMVRIVAPQQEPTLWLRPDARYGHLMKPDFHQRVGFPGSDFVMDVRTNSLGFRDDEPAAPVQRVPTVVFLGDSFTFGHGIAVEDRFDNVATRMLSEKGIRIRSINVGVSAWGTIQQTRYLLDHLDQFKPDIVVLTFCENDPTDDNYYLRTGISFDTVRFPGKDFLRAHSHLFRWLQQLYLVMRKWQTAVPAHASAQAPSPQPDLAAMAHSAPLITEAQWASTEETLRDFTQQWRGRHPEARLLVQCTVPWDNTIASRLEALCARIGAQYVHLAGAAALKPEERRLSYDGHWSQAMHRVSAVALCEQLSGMVAGFSSKREP